MAMILETLDSAAQTYTNLVKGAMEAEVTTKIEELRTKMLKEVDEYVTVLKKGMLDRISIDFIRKETDAGIQFTVTAKINDQELLQDI